MGKGNEEIYHGIWWLPGSSKNIHGILKVEDQSLATFETLDTFEKEGSHPFVGKSIKHECIFGLASSMLDNKEYSFRLYSLIEINVSSQVFTKIKFKVTRVLKGSANPNDSSNTFESVRLSSLFWKHWVKSKGLKKERLRYDKTKYGYKVEYRQPEAITLFKSEGTHVYINFRANTSFNKEQDFVLVESPFLNFEFEGLKSIKEIILLKTSLERFFMILWEKAHQFDKFDMRSADGTDFENVSPTQEPTTGWNTKYAFEEFTTNSQDLIQGWLTMAKEDRLVIDTFFFAFVDYKMAIENRFLNYLFALELYHRKKVRATQPLSKKNERMYNLTMETVKIGAVESWLKKVLNHERDISLKERLPELLNFIDNRKGISLNTDIITRCVQTRHYLVHLDEKHADKRFSAEELLKINDSLETLMLRLLKKELFECQMRG